MKNSSLASVTLTTEPVTMKISAERMPNVSTLAPRTVTTRLLCVTILATLCLVLVLPGTALAAGEDVWYAMGVTVYDLEEGKEPTLVMASQAREGTELPVDVAIAIPKGAEVLWAGQILGGDPAADPQLEATIDTGTDYDVLRFTLTQSLIAQIEMAMPQDWITSTDDGRRIGVEWTSAGLVDRARVAITVPLTYHLEDVVPTSHVEVRPNDVLYSAETSPVAAGQTIVLSGVMVEGPAPELIAMMSQADEESADSTSGTGSAGVQPIRASDEPTEDEGIDTTWIIVGVLGAIVAVLVVVIISRSRADDTLPQADEEDAEDSSESSEE